MTRSRNLAIKLILISTCMAALSLVHAAGDEANAAFDCTSCHRMPPRDAPFRDWLTGGFKGNHQTHQPSGATIADCAACHAAAGYSNGHMNRRIEFQANIKNSPATGVYRVNGSPVAFKNQTTVPQLGQCGNVNCHFETDTPLWGSTPFSYTGPAANDCNKCHGIPPAGIGSIPAGGVAGSHGKHDLYYGGVEKCGTCHPNHLTDTNRFSHATSAGGRGLVVQPKDPLGFPGGIYTGALNDYLPSQTNSFGSCTDTYCHSEGKSFTPPYLQQAPVAWGSTVSCTGCHNGAPTYASGKANSHSSHNFSCDNCHSTVYANGAIIDRSRHVNRAYDVQSGGGSSFAITVQGTPATPTQCSNINCHGNSSATWGSNAGCLTCHENGIGNRAGIGPQFRGNSHHVQGVTVNGTHCHSCHWEANSDGTINRSYHQRTLNAPIDLVIYGAGVRPTSYSVGTTAVQYTANGTRTELAKINLHCLGCHSTANDAATPFNDGKTPKSYAWDATSIKARYGDTTTTTWGKYSGGNVTPKNKVTKAFSAHGNATANQGGWDLNETWPNKRAGTVNILCFDCHNAHGSTVSGTTTSYASATLNGGILKDTVAGKGGYSTTYKPAAGGSSANRNSYNAGAGLCFDCHLNASAGITPWGYSSTFGATQAILGYTDTPYFGPGTFGTQQRYPYKATAHMGGHLGVSSTLLVSATRPINGLCTPCHDPHGVSTAMGANRQYAVPLLKGTWLTSPYKEDSATRDNRNYLYLAAPPNQHAPRPTPGTYAAYTSAIKSYKIDQNTFASGAITQTDAQFAGLCLSCHPKSSLTGTTHTWKSKDRVHESVKGWKTANTTIKHSYSCSKCHAPHNARLPRLMVSNCLDYKHRGRVTNNANPVTSGSYIGDDGRGSGRIPGSYAGGRSRGGAYVDKTFTCHENYDSGQKWNTKTPWTQ